MASSTRGGKRGSKKRVKMQPTERGGQIYMSDDYAKKFRNTYAGNTGLQKLIDKTMTERMHAGLKTPEESGKMSSDIFVDQVDEAIRKKSVKKKYGGKVQKMANGGAVRGYKGGGKVGGCRGGGAAMAGTKFSGCK